MKICKECGKSCADDIFSCEECGSRRLAKVSEKLCAYCSEKVARGTIICPHCHRVLPPEIEGAEVETSEFMPLSKSMESGATSNVHEVSPIPFSQVNIERDEKPNDNIDVRAKNINEYALQNPLFAINESEKEEISNENIAEIRQANSQKEETMTEKGSVGVIETVQFNTRAISREEEAPQSKLPRIALCLFTCLYILIGLFTDYMVHEWGNVMGFDMSCAIFTKAKDVFPCSYPYILYGTNLIPKYEMWGSYLPFAMVNGMVISIYASIAIMLAKLPKWIVATLNGVAFAMQLAGVLVLAYLFGSSAVGISGYILVFGSLIVFILHLILIKRVLRKPRI